MTDRDDTGPVRYSYKPSLVGAPYDFELTEQGLSYRAGFRTDEWPYRDISEIRLTYRPVSMLAHRFRADIRNRAGKKLTVISATWSSIVTLSPQNDAYCAFMRELLRRVAVEGGQVACYAGMQPAVFAASVATLSLVMIALAGLLIRALSTEAYPAALFMLGFAAWFGWYIGGWLSRNKPGSYEPSSPPARLLP